MTINQLSIKRMVFELFFVIDDGKELGHIKDNGNGKLCL